MAAPDDNSANDCPFCSIAAGDDVDVHVVAQGERWVAFFPRRPATPGHTLIIPRQHSADLWQTSEPIARDLMAAVLLVGRAISESLQPSGMNLITSSGRVAEQTVFHVHLHLVPRWPGDNFGKIWPDSPAVAERTLIQLAERIRDGLAS